MMESPPAPRLDPRLARRLAEKKAQLDQRRPLPAAVVRRLYEDLRVLLTYHSNAIEGNTLSLRETQLIIEHGVTVGGHSLREYLEATNHAAAFGYLTTLADERTPITVPTILELHRLTMAQILEQAGRFRTTPVAIRGARLTPPPAAQVPGLMAEWVAWLAGPRQAYEPLMRAAIAHHGFEAVHPFEDGNGRTGRLVLNLMLMRAGYPPALLLRDWRIGYVQALATADTGTYTPLANLIGRAVEGGLDLYLAACAAVPEEGYQPLAELARVTGYARTHLGWLVRQGRLAAVKRGGRWYSTLAAVERYRAEVEQGEMPRGRPRGDR
jgi:cell filamentation protein, protein adenylyltransferase